MAAILTIFAILGIINVFTGGMVGKAFNDAAEEKRARQARTDEIQTLTLEVLKTAEPEKVEKPVRVASKQIVNEQTHKPVTLHIRQWTS